jgi:hypothetical protein
MWTSGQVIPALRTVLFLVVQRERKKIELSMAFILHPSPPSWAQTLARQMPQAAHRGVDSVVPGPWQDRVLALAKGQVGSWTRLAQKKPTPHWQACPAQKSQGCARRHPGRCVRQRQAAAQRAHRPLAPWQRQQAGCAAPLGSTGPSPTPVRCCQTHGRNGCSAANRALASAAHHRLDRRWRKTGSG